MSSADIQARTALSDAIARMEVQLAQEPAPSTRLAIPGEAELEALHDSVHDSVTEVARALEKVAGLCALIGERLEADRLERRALTDAIARLAEPGAAPVDVPPSSVLGGTVFASPPVPGESEISIVEDDATPAETRREPASIFASPPPPREREITLLDDDAQGTQAPSTPRSLFASPPPPREGEVSIVEEPAASDEAAIPASDEPTSEGMWCREDDKWIGGVEIADFSSDNGTIRYWLRRTSDGSMLPRPFDAADLRFVRETTSAAGEI